MPNSQVINCTVLEVYSIFHLLNVQLLFCIPVASFKTLARKQNVSLSRNSTIKYSFGQMNSHTEYSLLSLSITDMFPFYLYISGFSSYYNDFSVIQLLSIVTTL